MIESNVLLLDQTLLTVTLRVQLVDKSGNGIERVSIHDRMGILIGEETFDCVPMAQFDTAPLLRTQFPIDVEAEECVTGEVSRVPGLALGGPNPNGPGIVVPCDPTFCSPTTACGDAKADLARAAAVVRSSCSAYQYTLDMLRELYARITAVAIAIAVATVALAASFAIPFVGWVLALLYAVMLAVLVGTLAGLLGLREDRRRQVAQTREGLRRSIVAFEEAADVVRRECCLRCDPVSLEPPPCNV